MTSLFSFCSLSLPLIFKWRRFESRICWNWWAFFCRIAPFQMIILLDRETSKKEILKHSRQLCSFRLYLRTFTTSKVKKKNSVSFNLWLPCKTRQDFACNQKSQDCKQHNYIAPFREKNQSLHFYRMWKNISVKWGYQSISSQKF